MPAPLEFWFEIASTYSYPAAMRIEGLALAAGVPLRWRPFLLGPIFATQGWNDSPFNIYPVKGRYMWQDLARVCAAEGVPLRRPSVFPRGSLVAARIACLAAEEPWLPAFVRAVYTANFAADRPIGEAEVIGELLHGLGLPADAWLARAATPEAKAALRAQTDAAAAHGIFGAPTFRVGDELFWGNDRLEDALTRAVTLSDDPERIDAVLTFWFGPPGESGMEASARTQRWFGADPAFDDEIRVRFGALVCAAARRRLEHWAGTARGRLALLLLLDQFTRNVYRGRIDAFASDPHALALALTGIDAGLDRQLDICERVFFYLPLEHAEHLAVQERSVALCTALHAESPPALRAFTDEARRYALVHRDLIARFGRFPHRNAALGRESTPAEVEYLRDGGVRFGQ